VTAYTCKVLLVDDDEPLRRALSKALRQVGIDSETVADGQEAVERLTGAAFDVIVTDLSMPRMGGLDFLREVRKHDLDVPVILMTGQPGLDSAIAAVEQGAYRYLTKPVEIDALEAVVRRAASMHQMAKLKREALELMGMEGRQLGDRASLEARFESALQQVWMAYQPIVKWRDRAVVAYEALVRSGEPSLRGPVDLFDAAERLGRVHDLGRRIRERVGSDAPATPGDALTFVNLHPVDLNDAELFSPSSPLAAIAHRVVFEITERASLREVHGLASKIGRLRELGFRIAVDDLGAGYAGLSSFAQLDPEFVKLDMSLVRGVDASARKRSVVRAMTNLCRNELRIQVVSEGVETPEEREVLNQEGCELLQGYLFAKPDRGFPAPRW
jgi:EAL domain-containing protein (putative c-di-GMP-specific phosphodiesterase class I)